MAATGRFDGKVAVVTGAGGFIGAAICRALGEEGAEVVGIEVSDAAAGRVRSTGAAPVLADVTEPASLAKPFAGADLVFHTAARVDDGGDMEEFVRVNVGGTANVMDAAADAGARVVHLSSVVVFGYDGPGVQEDASACLRSYGIPYLDTKSASDRLARLRGAVVVRPGDVYGPGSVPWVLRPVELARSRQLAYPDEGALMLPVYVDDLVEAILLATLHGKPGAAYAAWSGEPVTFAEYFRRLCDVAGAQPPRRLPRPVLNGVGALAEQLDRIRGRPPRFTARASTFVSRRGLVSNRRAREELGWEAAVGLAEGLERVRVSLGEHGPNGGSAASCD